MQADDPRPDQLMHLVRELEAALAAEDRDRILIRHHQVTMRIMLRYGNVDPRRYEEDHPDQETPG